MREGRCGGKVGDEEGMSALRVMSSERCVYKKLSAVHILTMSALALLKR